MKKAKWSLILIVLVVLATLPALVGFAGGQEEKVTLRVTNYAQVEKAFVAINAEYMKLHPDVQIVYEPTPYDSYQQKFGAIIATKSGADVMGNELAYLWDSADSFIPLNERIKTEPAVFDDLLAYNMIYRYMDTSGPLLGLPMSFNGNVMYFNKDILRQAGLDPDNPPQTWEDFGKACEAVKKIGKVPMAMAGREVPLVWNWPEVQKNFWSSDQDILDLGRGKIAWSDPRMQNGLKLLTSMADKGWFQEGWATYQGIPDALDLFSSGGAAFIGSIISDVANWKQYEDALGQDKVGVMLWPAVDPNNPMMKKFSGFQGFPHCIAKWTKYPDAAWDYVKFRRAPRVKTSSSSTPADSRSTRSSTRASPAVLPTSPRSRNSSRTTRSSRYSCSARASRTRWPAAGRSTARGTSPSRPGPRCCRMRSISRAIRS